MPTLRAVTNLDSLKTIEDLDGMWNIIRPEISRRTNNKQFTCLPHITDGYLYNIGGLIVKTSQAGCCFKTRTFLPLGPIECFLDKRRTLDHWDGRHSLLPSTTQITNLGRYLQEKKGDTISSRRFTRPGFTIVLEDIIAHKELKLNIESMYMRTMSPGIDPVGRIVIDRSKHPELSTAKEIYVVTKIQEADRLELTGTIGPRARVFHLINRYPLLFNYEKIKLNEEGKAVSKMECRYADERTEWIRGNPTEKVEGSWGPSWRTKDEQEKEDQEIIQLQRTAEIRPFLGSK